MVLKLVSRGFSSGSPAAPRHRSRTYILPPVPEPPALQGTPQAMRRRATSAAALLLAATILLATGASAERLVRGNLEISALGRIEPFRLPRTTPAPISIIVAGRLVTTDGSTPPQLKRMTIDVNRHGLLQSKGLGVCPPSRLVASSSQTALKGCRNALVGSGRFWAHIVLPDQRPYLTAGNLLAFNGREHGHPVLLVHVFTSNPFFSSFVVPFAIHKIHEGPYGTELTTSLPPALGSWGYVEQIKMTLKRIYDYKGRTLSYFNAACPAPKGFRGTVFPFAHASFFFSNAEPLEITLNRPCAVAG